jgi:isopentenyl-diphosphate delta-isomerase
MDKPPHKNADKQVIAVDEEGNKKGLVNRLEAHTRYSILHRAFTCLVFDQRGNLLLARRSPEKRLWNGYWDGTVASHQASGETDKEAAVLRLGDELGIEPRQIQDIKVTDEFQYKRSFEDKGVEHEVCSVLKAVLNDPTLDPDAEEVQGLLWVPYDDLKESPANYDQLDLCPWFEIAVNRDRD